MITSTVIELLSYLPSVTPDATFCHIFMRFCLLVKMFRLSKVPFLALILYGLRVYFFILLSHLWLQPRPHLTPQPHTHLACWIPRLGCTQEGVMSLRLITNRQEVNVFLPKPTSVFSILVDGAVIQIKSQVQSHPGILSPLMPYPISSAF